VCNPSWLINNIHRINFTLPLIPVLYCCFTRRFPCHWLWRFGGDSRAISTYLDGVYPPASCPHYRPALSPIRPARWQWPQPPHHPSSQRSRSRRSPEGGMAYVASRFGHWLFPPTRRCSCQDAGQCITPAPCRGRSVLIHGGKLRRPCCMLVFDRRNCDVDSGPPGDWHRRRHDFAQDEQQRVDVSMPRHAARDRPSTLCCRYPTSPLHLWFGESGAQWSVQAKRDCRSNLPNSNEELASGTKLDLV